MAGIAYMYGRNNQLWGPDRIHQGPSLSCSPGSSEVTGALHQIQPAIALCWHSGPGNSGPTQIAVGTSSGSWKEGRQKEVLFRLAGAKNSCMCLTSPPACPLLVCVPEILFPSCQSHLGHSHC